MKTMTVKVDWDLYDEDTGEVLDINDICGLKEIVTFNVSDLDGQDVEDYLSDIYGFCVNSWYEVK